MQEIVASCENNRFEIEAALDQQLGAQSLPFPGMDKSGASVCTFFLKNLCARANSCPFRHVTGTQTVVCKHWLRGLCKKGDACEFLHEYDMSKMPECYFYARLGQCCNKECPFLHIDPESKIKDCAWYDRGFCRHGPLCKNRHVRRIICPNYLFGFCQDGKECKFVHPRFEIPTVDPTQQKKTTFVCHSCGEVGHKSAWCLKKNLMNPTVLGGPRVPSQGHDPTGTNPALTTIQPTQHHSHGHTHGFGQYPRPENYVPGQRRPLESVTCFKCGEKGHYANRCPKGHLAFLHTPTAPPTQSG